MNVKEAKIGMENLVNLYKELSKTNNKTNKIHSILSKISDKYEFSKGITIKTMILSYFKAIFTNGRVNKRLILYGNIDKSFGITIGRTGFRILYMGKYETVENFIGIETLYNNKENVIKD